MLTDTQPTIVGPLTGLCGFEPNYWLRRCEGFEVVTSAGRLGYVDEVRFGSRIDRPDFIVFRSRLRRRHVVVPVSEIEEIAPERERITLRTGRHGHLPAIGPHEPSAGPNGRRAA
jgi:hypothetical protein